MKVLVTGATGFVAAGVIARLAVDARYHVRAAVRFDSARFPPEVETAVIGELGPDTPWQHTLEGVDAVIHLGARVHVMRDSVTDPLAEFRRVNVAGTLSLARAAAVAGVKRFVFLSSVKVHGEGCYVSTGQRSSDWVSQFPYTETDTLAPRDAYGVSKLEAETGLRRIASETDMAVVIIRSPLVYGPGVKANFLSMIRWLYKGVPLPMGAVHNKRSLVALANLVDLIVVCLDHPAAANQIFLVSDNEDLSTTELLNRMSVALGVHARLFPVPVWFLKSGAALIGRRAMAERLLGTLQVDSSKVREVLHWQPPVSVDEALRQTAEDFLARRRN